ncbi:hypothetical protein QYM36_002672 [Artemia franciscana]|uniref:Uncharacterized protein n=1 Tax=Artemia franciscana TaxID=6661 RepID=A0AA88I6J1_ARTSF|nr:hypothetical protein QYM36_002672 [Artemia franciscana]
MVQCARRLIPSSYERHGGRYKARQSSNGSSVRGELPKNDSEYGPNCQTPDLLPTEFEAAKQLYLRKMKPSIDQLKKLPVITAGQADNPKWISQRMETISSTRFRSIRVRRPATSSARLVKEIVTWKQMYCGILLRGSQEHKYYYQIQGQLNIVDKEICFLIAFVDENDFKIVEVQRDTEFWKKMLPKLVYFWEHCLLPELIDSRLV